MTKSIQFRSWNVNGIRAAQKNGYLKWLADDGADIVCLQETKARPDQLDEALLAPAGYKSWYHSAKKPGYSGVAIYSRISPDNVIEGIGVSSIDDEGRVIIGEYPEWTVINAYFPNSQREHARLPYKLAFCREIKKVCEKYRKKGTVLLCGDYNIAHRPIDLKNPKANEKNAGFLPEERAWMESFVGGKGKSSDYIDTFRHFEKGPEHYTWWSYRPGIRARNIGWRLDYFCINPESADRLASAGHQTKVMGSDHCPVALSLKA